MNSQAMDNLISRKLRKLEPYHPESADTPCSIHLDANESCLELPDQMKKKISEQILDIHYNRYPDPLATGVCTAFGANYGVPARFVTAGNGSDELISIIMNSFVDRGGKVLMTQPDFSMYQFYCQSYECEPVVVGKNSDLTFDPDEMIQKANEEKVRLIIFSNPCNPTGQGITQDIVLKIVNSVNCIVVVDEAYMDFWDQSVLEYATSAANMIVLKTCSKIGLAAARMGFAVANSEITDYLRAAKSPYNINSLTQAAAECFLNDQGYIRGAVEAIKRSRDRLFSALKQIENNYPDVLKVYGSHTNFVLINSIKADEIHRFLQDSGISVRYFGNGVLRITAGTQAENQALLDTIRKYMLLTQKK